MNRYEFVKFFFFDEMPSGTVSFADYTNDDEGNVLCQKGIWVLWCQFEPSSWWAINKIQ